MPENEEPTGGGQEQQTQTDPPISDSATAAETAAALIRTSTYDFKEQWGDERDSILQWLKDMVDGDDELEVDENLKKLRDQIIPDAYDGHSVAEQYLWQSRTFVRYLTTDPELIIPPTEGPRDDDNTTKPLPDIPDMYELLDLPDIPENPGSPV